MRAELRSQLLAVARGDFSPQSGVPHVTGVTGPVCSVTKPMELRQLRGLRLENDRLEDDLKSGVTAPVTSHSDLEDALSERLAIVENDGAIPAVFREAWVRVNCEQPSAVSEERWWNAVVVGGLLLETWGERAAELGWRADDLFALDTGLVWLLADCGRLALVALDQAGADFLADGERRRYMRRWTQ
jgi:hypothetical protein